MHENDERYTAGDAATANTVLRAALGLAPERFGTEQFVGMISDEIDLLRRAGKTDAEIAQLLEKDGGLDVSADAITQFYADPDERRRPG
ncbi:MAG TPA: hypothetical protein VGU66_01485 [Candidatus Elarobacter sp.]|nr:hypothetical protein [Candidatus Elarobacter sp.]